MLSKIRCYDKVAGCGGLPSLLDLEADLTASDRGRVEFRDCAERRGKVRGWFSVVMTGDSA